MKRQSTQHSGSVWLWYFFSKVQKRVYNNFSHGLKLLPLAFLFASSFLVLSGCDEPFEPIQDTAKNPFSMYGYLDASADTQWVRITPVRKQVDAPLEHPDMTVTLEHIESGEKVVMQDSLFQLVGGFNTVNVYSSGLDVKPNQTYRLRAERSDGASSRVTVTIPSDFPSPVLFTEGFYNEDGELYIKGIEKVADVLSIWQFDGGVHIVPYRFRIRPYNSVEYDYSVDFNADNAIPFIFGEEAPPPYATDIYESYEVRRQVFVASGGPEWLESIVDLDDQAYALPQVVSNIENGTGYVIGIVSKTIPFKTCRNDEGELIACPLEKPMF